jgi:hypothetical protein
VIALVAGLALALWAGIARAETVTVAPDDPDEPDNCFPFGQGTTWTPYLANFYRDVPSFELVPGDILAFDLGDTNDADIEMDVALAPTTTNGGTTQAQPFTSVANNGQTPENPRGDTTVGNFELRFEVEDTFEFAGGGLIIRMSSPSSSFALDNTCTSVLGGASATDPSGFFIQRSIADADGVSPWDNINPGDIAAFRVTETDPPETTITKGPKKKTEKDKAKLKFKSDEPGSFECKLDKRRFKPCDSPKKYKGLDLGKHKFKVRATDEGGNTDPTPAKRKWTVLGD